MAQGEDRRTVRTRTALIHAFDQLVLGRAKRKIRVADIVAEANVGRSTFYEHYGSADEIHMAALARPFAILADAAAGLGEETRLTGLLAHFWDYRQQARGSLSDRTGEKAARMLADLVEERLRPDEAALALPLRLAAMQLAEAALAPIRGWITAEAPATSEMLAAAICTCGRAMRAALQRPS
ncbi:MAG: hypothetical protein JO276_04795 [Sphingomonadaceae bacterium]|nr:hypothetical protein [Sphingomonadaceae bacterium]